MLDDWIDSQLTQEDRPHFWCVVINSFFGWMTNLLPLPKRKATDTSGKESA